MKAAITINHEYSREVAKTTSRLFKCIQVTLYRNILMEMENTTFPNIVSLNESMYFPKKVKNFIYIFTKLSDINTAQVSIVNNFVPAEPKSKL